MLVGGGLGAKLLEVALGGLLGKKGGVGAEIYAVREAAGWLEFESGGEWREKVKCKVGNHNGY